MSVFDQQRARTYDAGARTVMAGYEALHEMSRDALAACLEPERPARVLLLGVGTGYEAEELSKRFPNWHLTGVDPSEPMLAEARKRLGDSLELRLGVLEDFPDLAGLDAVLSIGVLHHLSNRQQQQDWLMAIGRSLRPGGVFLTGCQVAPYSETSLRMRALQARWRWSGYSEDEVRERTQMFVTHTLPPDRALLEQWYAAAGLSSPEVLFSTAFFQLLGSLASK
ncbi:class I SAM-dependent methyltransferase [bacterium]|nr:class I SAM-dependent methyltransferase [bacterium]